jgi:membrane associated rhomboid family serine protease
MEASFSTLILLFSIGAVSWLGWRNRQLFDHLILDTQAVRRGRQWHRLLSHGWLHADGLHLGMNLLVLYIFGGGVEIWLGEYSTMVVFIVGVLAGAWITLLIHQFHDYHSVGASGGVCAVIFASIALSPDIEIMSFWMPIGIPGWLFGMLYLVGSYVQARAQSGGIGQEAHFGGAASGLVAAFVWEPRACLESPLEFGVLGAIAGIGFYWFWRNPLGLPIRAFRSAKPIKSKSRTNPPEVDTLHDSELDRLLEKVGRLGMAGLTQIEQVELNKISQRMARRKKGKD